eukprot:SAG11_NODE_6288_length_1344_cov_0.857831_1_plen_167_part_10
MGADAAKLGFRRAGPTAACSALGPTKLRCAAVSRQAARCSPLIRLRPLYSIRARRAELSDANRFAGWGSDSSKQRWSGAQRCLARSRLGAHAEVLMLVNCCASPCFRTLGVWSERQQWRGRWQRWIGTPWQPVLRPLTASVSYRGGTWLKIFAPCFLLLQASIVSMS